MRKTGRNGTSCSIVPCWRRRCFSGSPSFLWKTFSGWSLEQRSVYPTFKTQVLQLLYFLFPIRCDDIINACGQTQLRGRRRETIRHPKNHPKFGLCNGRLSMRFGSTTDWRGSVTAQINTFPLWIIIISICLCLFKHKVRVYRPCDVVNIADPSRVTAMPVTALHVQTKAAPSLPNSPNSRLRNRLLFS